jgi:hypothetical protein
MKNSMRWYISVSIWLINNQILICVHQLREVHIEGDVLNYEELIKIMMTK